LNKSNLYNPGPDSYKLPFGFDLTENEKDAGSRPFRQPVPKKIVPVNLYNPHSEVSNDDKLGPPGPGKYNIPSFFEQTDISAEY
jgi:hypothetical protein